MLNIVQAIRLQDCAGVRLPLGEAAYGPGVEVVVLVALRNYALQAYVHSRYTFRRLDGSTSIGSRLRLIDEFNGGCQTARYCSLLTIYNYVSGCSTSH